MVTAQELVDSSSRAELVDQAADLGIDEKGEDGKKLNMQELAEAILAAEADIIAEDDESSDEPDGDDDTDNVSSVDEVKAIEPDVDENAGDIEAAEGEDVLVRFVGQNPVLEVAGQAFKKSAPFKVLPDNEAQLLFDDEQHGHKFRVATPKEAKEFYS